MANVSPLLISMLVLLVSYCEAREYVVGGSEQSWKVPLSSPNSLQQWANTSQFMIGDALGGAMNKVFKYNKKTESVHVVNEEDYRMCNTVGKHHKVFKDGHSKLLLTSSEPIYIISGHKDHCLEGLKFAVIVSSEHHALAPSPSPSPSTTTSHGVVGISSVGLIGVSLLMGMMLFIV